MYPMLPTMPSIPNNPQAQSEPMPDATPMQLADGGSTQGMGIPQEMPNPEQMAAKPAMIICHVSKDEEKLFNQMQGGESIDPETGLPEYSKLSATFNDPNVREHFISIAHDVLTQLKKPKGDMPDDIYPGQWSKPPADNNPMVQKLEHEAGSDHELALLPEDVANFFDTLIGGRDINPRTGLRRYFEMSKFAMPALMGVGSMISGMFGADDEEENAEQAMMQYMAAKEAERQRHRDMMRQSHEFYGTFKPLYDAKSFEHVPDRRADLAPHRYAMQKASIATPFKKGGHAKVGIKHEQVPAYSHALKGPGKGQDDKIYTDVNDGDYIIDASTTGGLGDGSTDKGVKELDRFVHSILRSHGASNSKKVQVPTHNKVPVALSDGEYKINHVVVSLLGNGSNKHGASIIDKAVKKMRRHKASGGGSLPPKSKSFAEYL